MWSISLHWFMSPDDRDLDSEVFIFQSLWGYHHIIIFNFFLFLLLFILLLVFSVLVLIYHNIFLTLCYTAEIPKTNLCWLCGKPHYSSKLFWVILYLNGDFHSFHQSFIGFFPLFHLKYYIWSCLNHSSWFKFLFDEKIDITVIMTLLPLDRRGDFRKYWKCILS